MSDEIKPQQIGVRASPDLWQQVRDAAKANGRSMNAEVISRLERSFLLDDLRGVVREELDRGRGLTSRYNHCPLPIGTGVVYTTKPAAVSGG